MLKKSHWPTDNITKYWFFNDLFAKKIVLERLIIVHEQYIQIDFCFKFLIRSVLSELMQFLKSKLNSVDIQFFTLLGLGWDFVKSKFKINLPNFFLEFTFSFSSVLIYQPATDLSIHTSSSLQILRIFRVQLGANDHLKRRKKTKTFKDFNSYVVRPVW